MLEMFDGFAKLALDEATDDASKKVQEYIAHHPLTCLGGVCALGAAAWGIRYFQSQYIKPKEVFAPAIWKIYRRNPVMKKFVENLNHLLDAKAINALKNWNVAIRFARAVRDIKTTHFDELAEILSDIIDSRQKEIDFFPATIKIEAQLSLAMIHISNMRDFLAYEAALRGRKEWVDILYRLFGQKLQLPEIKTGVALPVEALGDEKKLFIHRLRALKADLVSVKPAYASYTLRLLIDSLLGTYKCAIATAFGRHSHQSLTEEDQITALKIIVKFELQSSLAPIVSSIDEATPVNVIREVFLTAAKFGRLEDVKHLLERFREFLKMENSSVLIRAFRSIVWLYVNEGLKRPKLLEFALHLAKTQNVPKDTILGLVTHLRIRAGENFEREKACATEIKRRKSQNQEIGSLEEERVDWELKGISAKGVADEILIRTGLAYRQVIQRFNEESYKIVGAIPVRPRF